MMGARANFASHAAGKSLLAWGKVWAYFQGHHEKIPSAGSRFPPGT
jgi:hypothetical protein